MHKLKKMKKKLENTTNKQPEQIVKYYFNEFPVKTRKDILKTINYVDTDGLNDSLYLMYEQIEKDKEEHLPLLLNSIVVNSLGYEYNEDIKKTCYQDYANKNISKFAKHFIAGQYKIFRNENEKLIISDAHNTNAIIKRLDESIRLIIELGVLGTIEIKDHLEAIKKDPKSVNGIVNKVLRR